MRIDPGGGKVKALNPNLAESDASCSRHRALILAVGCLVFLWTGGFWDIWGPDEARYTIIARELTQRGNWFLLTLFGHPYDQKPPLPFWIWALILKANGGSISSWALRLPSAFFAILSPLLTYEIGRRFFNARAALMAAFFLMSSIEFLDHAHTVMLDMQFAGWITVALYAWFTRPPDQPFSPGRTLLFWGAVACAFFTKGPLVFFIVAVAMIADVWGCRSWRDLSSCHPLIGIPIISALIGAWLYLQAMAAGGEFVREQVVGQTIDRFLQGSHDEVFWYYFPRIFSSIFAPWAVLLIPAGILLWKQRRELPFGMMGMIGWFIIPLIGFTLANGKRQSYLLPLLPAMAIITGWYVDRQLLDRMMSPRLRRVAAGGFIFVSIFGLGIAIWDRVDPSYFWQKQFYATWLDAAIWIVMAIFFGGLAISILRRKSIQALFAHLIIAVLALAITLLVSVKPAQNERVSTRNFSQYLNTMLPGGFQMVGAIGRVEKPEYHVYGTYKVRSIDEQSQEIKDSSKLPDFLICRKQDWKLVQEPLEKGGFKRVRTIEASDDPISIIARRSAATPVDSQAAENRGPIKLLALGDTGTGDSHQRQIAEQMEKVSGQNRISGILLLGDNLYGDQPLAAAFEDRFQKPYQNLIEKNVPFYAVLGNHDFDDPELRKYELEAPLFRMNGRLYYSVDFGDKIATCFMLCGDTLDTDPKQLKWLREELDNCNSAWKIIVIHYPLLASKISHGGSKSLYRLLKKELTDKPGIDLVLAGHNHLYERRRVTDGVLHITNGNGGQLEGAEKFPDDPNRAVGYNDSRCFLQLDLTTATLRLQALDERGKSIDDATFTQDDNGKVIDVNSGQPSVVSSASNSLNNTE